MDWISRINDALVANRLRFHGQLIAPTIGDEWRCELLLRLCDEHGVLHPAAQFIQAAERYHMARTIDRWVVENALQQIRLHQRELPWIRHWHINLSGQSVDCEALLPEIIDQIVSQGVP
ncbi:MAG: EAL domain-containing protein, partial [Wenzhouxiangellaceae bacterium]